MTALKLTIRDNLLQLIEQNRKFKQAVLHDSHFPAWVMEGASGSIASRKKAADLTTTLTYIPAQNRQKTLKCLGIIGISQHTYKIGLTLNEKKDHFKKAMQHYREAYGKSFSMTSLSSKDIRESLLGNLKLQHLHFVQTYRHLKLFPEAPQRIGFSWAASHTGAVRLSAKKAIHHLQSKFTLSQGLKADIELIESLPDTTEVIIKRSLIPHLRANLTWGEAIESKTKHDSTLKTLFPAQINVPLPIFICMNKGESLPDFNKIRPLDPSSKQERLQRKDATLKKLSSRAGSMIYVEQT